MKVTEVPKGTLYGKVVSFTKGSSMDHDLAELKNVKIGSVLPIIGILASGDQVRVFTKNKGSYYAGVFDFYRNKSCTKPVDIRSL